ncbi:DNA-binding FadR family transcriptional regulator [Saccharothrix longispora]|uniref:DNA-binding FadR family transcriptional regulator n=1 Tax=Saccharothrix longispora TaxID=33920 RepID=A0ABU1PZL6_9PSEU|nr:DNA-binding FadR family transcriptional regulator [Saccharothrix longispora]
MATTRRAGLVDQVIDQMRGAIAAGEWPVGRRIPPEPELVTALGVGRNTVREAVRALSHAGLLEVRQGDGTFVRATSELSGAVRRMCGSELRDVLQVRRTLEVEGARLAATNRTDDELRRLEELLAERDEALGAKDWAKLVERDTAFHVLLVRCSHNTLLAELYQGLTEAVRASITATVETDHDDDQVSHTGLLDAVRDRDAARAAVEAGGFLEDLLERHKH